MSAPNEPLQKFFSQFNFQRYTYDPHKPPLEEFKRLCQERQWGASKIRKHETAFLLAVEEGKDLKGSLLVPGPNLVEFFRKYEYQRFTYDLDAPIQSEFQRLVGQRGWGEKNLSKVTKQFNKAVASDAREQLVSSASKPTDPEDPGKQKVDLLADWLRKQECPGYKYREGLPELEFRKLHWVKRREWNQVRKEAGMDTGNEAWKKSTEFNLFNLLRTEFYEIVEKAFNLLLDRFCQITGLTPWQVLVGLYRPGVYSPEQGMVGPYGQEQESIGLYNQGLESMEKEDAKIVRFTKGPA